MSEFAIAAAQAFCAAVNVDAEARRQWATVSRDNRPLVIGRFLTTFKDAYVAALEIERKDF